MTTKVRNIFVVALALVLGTSLALAGPSISGGGNTYTVDASTGLALNAATNQISHSTWTSDLLPTANGTQNLGSDSFGWNNAWISILSTRGSGGEVWAFATSGGASDFYSDQNNTQPSPAFTFTMNNTPSTAGKVVLGAQYSTTQTIPSTDDYVWTVLADGSMCINGLAGAAFAGCNDKITAGTGSASLLASVFVGAVTTATTTFGGDVLPAYPFTVSQVTMRTSVIGSGGSTDFIFRVTDATNTCDCTMACNAAIGNKSLTCAGTAGTGCTFAGAASLTYSVQSIGDCTVGPTVVGNVQIRGSWK